MNEPKVWEKTTPFFPYVLVLEGGLEVYGLDAREPHELEADWLAKVARSERAAAVVDRARVRAEILNDLAFERKREQDDPVLGQATVSLDEVHPAPGDEPGADEVLHLVGLESGYGAVAVMASQVVGVARAWGEFAEDLCAGVTPPKPRRKRRVRR